MKKLLSTSIFCLFAKRKITAIALWVILVVGMTSCNKRLDVCWSVLRGTQWKLEYIGDTSKGPIEMIILDPQDCDTCFTLSFDSEKEWHISGVSILNTFSIQWSREQPDMQILMTDMDEPFDGNLFSSLIKSVTGINTDAGINFAGSILVLFVYKDPGSEYATHTLIFRRITP